PIRHGRAGHVAVLVDLAREVGFGQLGGHVLLPQDLAGLPVQADEVPAEVRHVAFLADGPAVAAVAGHEDAVAPGDRTGRAGAGQPGLPDDVFLVVPPDRQAVLVTDAVGVRPAEARPVGAGENNQRQNSEGGYRRA